MVKGGTGARGRRQLRRQVPQDGHDQVTNGVTAADLEEESSGDDAISHGTDDDASNTDEHESQDERPIGQSYHALLQSFLPSEDAKPDRHRRKRRKLDSVDKEFGNGTNATAGEASQHTQVLESDDDAVLQGSESSEEEIADDDQVEEHEVEDHDFYSRHFEVTDESLLKRHISKIAAGDWMRQSKTQHKINITTQYPQSDTIPTYDDFKLSDPSFSLCFKGRLQASSKKVLAQLAQADKDVVHQMLRYRDVMCGSRTLENCDTLRRAIAIHALNHIFKGRDRVLKNNEKIAKDPDCEQDLRDQGFTRPKVLILLETRQACYKYMEDMAELSGAIQQENKKRFHDSFSSNDRVRDDLPEDYHELFDGNRDDNFKIAVKLTRKTIKYFSAFYASDIILASPLGLRGVIDNADPKKSDHDFLSSIEMVIIDQADAMLMQNWDHAEYVLSQLNLQPSQAHSTDYSRVRSWYLDNQAGYLRQTIVLSGYLTPALNRLYNSSMKNVEGKFKFAPVYNGAIMSTTGLDIKQTFSRFDASNPVADPDERFAYFTSAVIPTLERHASSSSSDDPAGIMIYVPSYLDFVRVRNFLQSAPAMQNVSSGSLSEYDSVSDARRARSHFLSGRFAILLYSERAHHFNRYRIRGVKRVVFYAPPENPVFFEEIVRGYLGTTVEQGKAEGSDVSVRVMFSKFDGLSLERVVGTERVRGMIGAKNVDTFDFV